MTAKLPQLGACAAKTLALPGNSQVNPQSLDEIRQSARLSFASPVTITEK